MSTVAESTLVGLIGTGVLPSLTPALHEAEADAQGLRYLYRPLDLAQMGRQPHDVGAIVEHGRQLGYNAFNITHPCKQLVLPHLDEITVDADRLRAVNTVLIRDGRLLGHNTDRTGFAAGLAYALPEADLTWVVQVGSGGAGSAVADALLGSGVGRLDLVDLDPARALERAESLATSFPDAEVHGAGIDALPGLLAEATGLVNCTPIGMHDHPGTPVAFDLLRPAMWVGEVVYRPLITPLLAAARRLGCPVLTGGEMAVGQAIDTFELITGRAVDAVRMRRHFAALTAAEDPAPVADPAPDSRAVAAPETAPNGELSR